MTKTMHLFLKALSDPDTKLDVQKSRRIMNLKLLDPFKPFYRTLDTKIYRDGPRQCLRPRRSRQRHEPGGLTPN